MNSTIYHLVERANWSSDQDAESYRPPSLAAEGFIHFSERDQVEGTAARFYAECESLLVVEVDVARLRPALRYEQADGQRFPHLFGALNLDAVVQVKAMQRDASGQYHLPAGF